jgi:hypothetical protein
MMMPRLAPYWTLTMLRKAALEMMAVQMAAPLQGSAWPTDSKQTYIKSNSALSPVNADASRKMNRCLMRPRPTMKPRAAKHEPIWVAVSVRDHVTIPSRNAQRSTSWPSCSIRCCIQCP